MIQINPYRRNCEVIKKFFSNPVTLIISILLFLSAFTSVALDFIKGTFPGFPVIELISALGFLFFFMKGRKKSEVSSFSQPINTLTISSIVSIVINALALIAIALLLLFKYSFNLSENILSYYILDDAIDLLKFYSPICFMNLLSSISLLVLLNAIKTSSKSIYLYKNGSLFFAFTSFMFAVVLIGLNIYEGISITSIGSIVGVVVLFMLGIFSIMYNRYITKVSSNIFVSEPVTKTIKSDPTPAPTHKPQPINPVRSENPIPEAQKTKTTSKSSKLSNYDNALVGMWGTPENKTSSYHSHQPTTPTDSFEPQPVFTQTNTVPVAPVNNANSVIDKPTGIKHHQETVEKNSLLFCTFCGKKCPPENLYCGSCGNKLTK